MAPLYDRCSGPRLYPCHLGHRSDQTPSRHIRIHLSREKYQKPVVPPPQPQQQQASMTIVYPTGRKRGILISVLSRPRHFHRHPPCYRRSRAHFLARASLTVDSHQCHEGLSLIERCRTSCLLCSHQTIHLLIQRNRCPRLRTDISRMTCQDRRCSIYRTRSCRGTRLCPTGTCSQALRRALTVTKDYTG